MFNFDINFNPVTSAGSVNKMDGVAKADGVSEVFGARQSNNTELTGLDDFEARTAARGAAYMSNMIENVIPDAFDGDVGGTYPVKLLD